MVRRAIAALVLAVAFTMPAAPASAHTNTYCGLGVHWHWPTRVEFIRHWTNTTGHWHEVVQNNGIQLYAYAYVVKC